MRFLIAGLLIWGSMHAYVWARVRAHSGLEPRWAVLLAAAMLLLMVSPIWGMMLTRTGRVGLGRPVETLGMVWTGVFFLFFSVSLLHDLLNVLLAVGGLVVPALRCARLGGPRVLAAQAGLVVAVAAYSAFEAWHIRTECVLIETSKLPAGLPHVRIVQISDVHLGGMVGRRRLARMTRLVSQAAPDLLVSTGDLVDADLADADDLADMLAGLSAPLGKYAVTGNHEYYAGLAAAGDFTRRAGFGLLSNECVRVREGLTVAGVDDETARRFGGGKVWDEQQVLSAADGQDYVVLLKHRPLVEPESLPLFDLQLSGHSHGGQIFPFSLLVAAHYRYGRGLVELAPGKHLYTSRGTGTWGPPMRFLSPPEVTVIDIVRAGP